MTDGFIERVESGAVFSEGEVNLQRVLVGQQVSMHPHDRMIHENRLALMLLCNRVAGMMARTLPSRGPLNID